MGGRGSRVRREECRDRVRVAGEGRRGWRRRVSRISRLRLRSPLVVRPSPRSVHGIEVSNRVLAPIVRTKVLNFVNGSGVATVGRRREWERVVTAAAQAPRRRSWRKRRSGHRQPAAHRERGAGRRAGRRRRGVCAVRGRANGPPPWVDDAAGSRAGRREGARGAAALRKGICVRHGPCVARGERDVT